ncbi:dihydrodipicolinate synthase family protein [Microbacterium sp. Marseille-Q6965]|uniref:dihydrodipicolinate synthase family protein n=1 Tax=Microbacterium sp. Marseille-Q6965 TaxID=2965072 RepID=UPI0021B81E63|nr:dihydrodipicolinate synthase family protein [Microbacterium sp. Marseille-Q6965]
MTGPFRGLSAFPLTPLRDDRVDEVAFAGLVERLAASDVDSITALGSTGAYAYLDTDERSRAARIAVERAGDKPVFVGVGALRTSHVLRNVAAAEDAGAAGVLLAPMTYLPLTDDDVFELFRAVSERTTLPVIVYDNPSTTRFTFTNELYGRIAQLPGIASIKIPGVPTEPFAARAHVATIRAVLPPHVTVGVSGDASAAGGLLAGCDAWYSVIAGTLPEAALRISDAAAGDDAEAARAESDRLAPLWELFGRHGGSLRVIAAIAEHRGLVPPGCLPLPIRGLSGEDLAEVIRVADALGLR